MKRSRTFAIALGGLACCFILFVLYFACFFPRGTLGIVAISGLFPYFVKLVSSFKGGFLCWGASSILGFLLLPEKSVAVLFTFCFGLYPLLKFKLEENNFLIAVVLKLCYANLSFLLCFICLKQVLFPLFPPFFHHYQVLLLGGNIYFLAYDYGLSQMNFVILRRLRLFLP